MIKNFQVTKHFSFYELTITYDHPELLQENREYFAVEPYLGRLEYASEYLLENTRDDVGLPIIVHNGGRYPALNKAVGGVPTSQHLFENHLDGAFDFHVLGMNIEDVADRIWFSGLTFFQMRVYIKDNFIHLGMPRRQNNMQVYWIGGIRPAWANK